MLPRLRPLLALLLLSSSLHAHDPGLSTLQVNLGKDGLVATAGYAPADVRTLLPPQKEPLPSNWTVSDLGAQKAALDLLSAHLVEARDSLGVIAWTGHSVALASGNSLIFTLSSSRAPSGTLSLRSLVSGKLPPGHRDYVSVTDRGGALLAEKLVAADDGAVVVPIAPDTTAGSATPVPTHEEPTFWGFLRLGIAHIWTGYDHLLFLFGLLIVCRSFKSIVGIISCFTVAHSITLALATMDIINLPSGIVEPMIAASIFYVGIENLVRKGAEPRGRWALTFAFGLIHGFGFASVLRELGIGSNGHGLAMPLFTFNLGVEIGQISIAAIVLPAVWQLRKNPNFVRRGIPILSAVVAAAGLYWFLERTVF